MSFDLVVRGGDVVTAAGVKRADVGVTDGVIAAVEPELTGARDEIDATGLHVLPGGLDPHVHFNEPGRTHWEGLATGSAALAGGRVHGVLRHAAELDAADDRRAPASTPSSPRRA